MYYVLINKQKTIYNSVRHAINFVFHLITVVTQMWLPNGVRKTGINFLATVALEKIQ
jgi:hypothetical protein